MTDEKALRALRDATPDSVALFSLKGRVMHAKLISAYDGDTGRIAFLLNGELTSMSARFAGFDSCEMKPPLSEPDRSETKRKAVLARNRLWELCTGAQFGAGDSHGTLVVARCGEFDKYGRLLVTAFDCDRFSVADVTRFDEREAFLNSINHVMIQEGHGRPYDGGRKLL